MKRILVVLAVSCLAFATSAFADQAKSYPEISLKDLKADIAAGKVTLIDVNGTDSYKSGHIPGAIDFEANQANLAKLLPTDQKALIVAYCGNPRCNAYKQGADAATKLGYTNVKHFTLGIQGWEKAGEKTEK